MLYIDTECSKWSQIFTIFHPDPHIIFIKSLVKQKETIFIYLFCIFEVLDWFGLEPALYTIDRGGQRPRIQPGTIDLDI